MELSRVTLYWTGTNLERDSYVYIHRRGLLSYIRPLHLRIRIGKEPVWKAHHE